MKETAHLRERAKDMTVMAEGYQKNPKQNTPGDVAAKFALIQHCQTLAATHAKAADEAEVMARAHRDLMSR